MFEEASELPNKSTMPQNECNAQQCLPIVKTGQEKHPFSPERIVARKEKHRQMFLFFSFHINKKNLVRVG